MVKISDSKLNKKIDAIHHVKDVALNKLYLIKTLSRNDLKEHLPDILKQLKIYLNVMCDSYLYAINSIEWDGHVKVYKAGDFKNKFDLETSLPNLDILKDIEKLYDKKDQKLRKKGWGT